MRERVLLASEDTEIDRVPVVLGATITSSRVRACPIELKTRLGIPLGDIEMLDVRRLPVDC